MKSNSVVLVALIALIHQSQGQLPLPTPERFIVAIAEVQPLITTTRCVGTAFTRRHVLTTAVCVNVPEIIVQLNFLNVSNSPATTNYPVSRIFTHPSFVATNRFASNVAVVHTYDELPVGTIRPRSLGVLGQATCNLYSVGGLIQDVPLENSVSLVVNVRLPAQCIPTQGEGYCATIPDDAVSQVLGCNALQGSPVVCGDGLSVNGFVISQGICENINNAPNVLFHAVNRYRAWIDEVSGAEANKNISLLLVISAALIIIKNMV